MEEKLEDRKKLDEKVKKILLRADKEIGYVLVKGRSELVSLPNYLINGAMPKKMFDLGHELGIGFPRNIMHHERGQGGGTTYPAFSTEFISASSAKGYDWCQKDIKKRQNKISKFQKKVLKDKSGKYDTKGNILIPKYSTNTGYEHEPNFRGEGPRAWVDSFIKIEITQRELAEAGILPEDFKWEEKVIVSPRDIADADREQALTITEVGGFKGFIKKLLDKFKGKGEK